MHKTLQRTFTPAKQHTPVQANHIEKKMLGVANKDLRSFWKEAASDLLQPRPEAVAALLKEISRLN